MSVLEANQAMQEIVIESHQRVSADLRLAQRALDEARETAQVMGVMLRAVLRAQGDGEIALAFSQAELERARAERLVLEPADDMMTVTLEARDG